MSEEPEVTLPAGREGAVVVTEEQELSENVWSLRATELDEIRRGVDYTEGGNGKQRAVHVPRHLVQARVFDFVVKVMQENTQMYVDAYPYVFVPQTSDIYKFHNPEDAYKLLSKLHLLLTQADYNLVRDNFQQYILANGRATRIEKLGNYRNHAIYINNGRGGMYCITEKSITDGPNGTDGVLVLYRNLLAMPEINEESLGKMREISHRLNGAGARVTEDSKLCKHLNALFAVSDGLNAQQYQQLVLLRWLSLFIGEALMLRPIMMATGEQNSGKSTLWEKFMWLLEGPAYDSEAMPPKIRDFTAAITNNPTKIFDNIDSVNFNSKHGDYPQYIDLMCKAATGGKVPIAQLYETNVEKTFDLRCNIFLTARVNPFPGDRSDLMRRTLLFPIRKPEREEYITVERMKRELMADREEIILETLIRLRNVLRGMEANANKEYPPMTEMHSFESWSMRLADHEGFLPEMEAIWQGYRWDYQERISEDNPLVEFVHRWIGSSPERNFGRWVRVGEIYKELKLYYSESFTTLYRTNSALGRRLKENQTALRSLGVDTKRLNGYTLYSFRPGEDALKQCVNSFTDSASRAYLGDPEDQEEVRDSVS